MGKAISNKAFLAGGLLALSASALFTGKVIVAKLVYARGVDPVGLVFLRMLFSLPFYAGILLFQLHRGARIGCRDVWTVMFLGILGYYVSSMLDFTGIRYISTALERMILQLAPSFVMLYGIVFCGDKFDRKLLVALVIGYVGVALMVGSELGSAPTAAHAANSWIGVLCVLGSTAIFAVSLIWGERLLRRVKSGVMTSIAMLAAGAAIFLHYAIAKGVVVPTHDPVALGWGAFLAIFCTVIPTYMNNEAVHLIGGARMGPFNYVGMGLTFVVSAFVLDERFPVFKLLGIILAVVGALALTLGRMGWSWSGRKPADKETAAAKRESAE